MEPFGGIDPAALDDPALPSPCYVVSQQAIERNLSCINQVQVRGGVKVLLALKGFAMWSLFPTIRRVLPGVTASSLNEARLGKEEFGGEVHVYSPAYCDAEFPALRLLADHLTFNSLPQWERFGATALARVTPPQCALRINPEHSEVRPAIYDPCAAGSRLGVTATTLARYQGNLDGLTGLHFHTLCQANADALERTLQVVEARFGDAIRRARWVNFGGGHHITRADYDLDKLIGLLNDFRQRYKVAIYLEPGEAVALNTGVLVASVLDIVHNHGNIAILDTSAAAHMPDVLEMPYRPPVLGARLPEAGNDHLYRLAGNSCLAGDVIGDYAFSQPLHVGKRVIFGDMAHYTMVKNTLFNGVQLPHIGIYDENTRRVRIVRRFGYDEYKTRLS